MRTKKILIILVIFVGSLMLMQSVLAATGPPIVWANQTTISTIDSIPSKDPENSGFGTVQVVVWEEQVGTNTHDIYMKYSLADGAVGTWFFSPVHPAITPSVDEINPSVAVTRPHSVTGQEIHVVYERRNPGPPARWEICHTYTTNFGVTWSPVLVLSRPTFDSHNPACVYTEDLAPNGTSIAFLVQVVWEEVRPTTIKQIMYDAFVYDPTWAGRGRLLPTPLIVHAPAGTNQPRFPEIASVDESSNPGQCDYTFSIVWQQSTLLGFNYIWYADGTSVSSPTGPAAVLTPGSKGQITRFNPANPWLDYIEPDIAATQDYWAPETYYFHIDYVQIMTLAPQIHTIESQYSAGTSPTPGFISFVLIVPPVYTSPVIPNVMNRPTIAAKLINLNLTIFEIWFSWEDYSGAGGTADIWYRVGQYTVGGAPPMFVYIVPAARVPYTPLTFIGQDYNPELWNRNEAIRMFPPVTHLVFERDPHPTGIFSEIEYIDP